MNNTASKSVRILKGVAIGLMCLFLALGGFLLVTMGQNKDSMEQNLPAADVYVPEAEQEDAPAEEVLPEETVPATEAVVEETVPSTEAPEVTEPEEDEDDEDSGSGSSKPSGGSSSNKPAKDEGIKATGKVTAENNVVTKEASFGKDGVSATVSAGTLLENNTSSLTLTVKEKKSSSSGIKVEAGQTLQPLDVHIDGVSAENTRPITVCLGKILPNGMNIGNVTLYHVENGTANAMTQVMTAAELDAHNEFYYDPATGDTTVSMASFSEIAVLSEAAKWEGKFDYSWYDANATELTIANADQLAAFGAIVGGMDGQAQDSFSGKTVKLISDINLGDKESENNPDLIFYPIGYNSSDGKYEKTGVAITSSLKNFEGTFDGQGHTISNFYQNTWEMKGDNSYYDAALQYYRDGMGLFGRVYGGTVKNLTVDNFSSDGEFTTTGTIAAYADCGATFENIAITNCNPRVYNIGNGGIVGCVGWYTKDTTDKKVTFSNITVDNSNKISALWGSYDVACGGIVGQYYPTSGQTSAGSPKNAGIHFDNCHVAAQMDVYNDVCANYQYYAYRYTGMMIGSVRENETIDGHVYPKMDGITATGCTVHFGDWNDYYYCELVANSLASYTHDHQMSRLEQVASVDVENKKVTSLDGEITDIPASGRYNYVVVKATDDDGKWIHGDGHDYAECYHFVNGEQHFHDVADSDNPNPTETVDGVEGVLKEDKQLVYREFDQLITGYGWGVTSKGIGEMDGVTILDREEATSVEKFAKADTAKTEYTTGATVTIGELFKATEAGLNEKTAIDADNVQVFVSPVGDDSTVEGKYEANTTDWTQGTLTFSGIGAATITITDYNFCTPTTVNVYIKDKDPVEKFATKFTGDFLYRVGNDDTTHVKLDSLFKQNDEYSGSIVNATVTIENVAGTASGTYTANASAWAQGTIDFDGTGVVKVTITDNDYCIPTELYLEVVNAKNTTSASFGGNSVLLNDVSTSNTLSTSGIIYGNGFTVNMENAPISEKNGAVFHLYDGAILKNLNIVCKEFTSVAMTVNDTNYGVSAVRAWGTVVIENCYISGCRSAVSVTGTELTIKDSVIANGVYANIDFRSGTLNLHNVTTINEPHTVDGKTIVGLGIVGNMTASAGRQLNITGTLTQYNWVSLADCSNIKATGVDSIFKSVFSDNKYASYRYTYNETTYANTGILSLSSDFGASAATGVPSNYSGLGVTATIAGVSADGYVWAPGEAGTLTDADMKYHNTVYTHTSTDQGTSYIPSAFNYAGAGLEVDSGVVQISYESGGSYTLTNATLKALLTAEKYGQPLNYTITMNGNDYTDSDIIFDTAASQTYTITYTITDSLVYDKDGTLTDKTYEVEKELKVFATVVDKGADAPTFTFYYGTNGSASAGTPHTTQPTNSYTSTIKQVGEVYYIMPNVSATTANAIGSQTVGSETIYYPIVDGINVRSGNTADYDFTRHYPVFKAVKISDNGTEYSYSGTKEMPATVAWVEATIDNGNGASSLGNGFGLYNNQYLCKIQAKAGDAESGGTSIVKFSYTALDGNTYYYYVGFRFYDESEGCITGDTLVTLADGSQVRVDALTGDEELLVWNLETGCYDTAPMVFIDTDAEAEYTVVNLHFSDGSEVGVIYEHGFFDYDLGKYVYLDADNAEDYIGHTFVTQGDISGNTWNTATLTDVVIEQKVTTAYSPVTFSHLCYYVDGVLSMPGGIEGLFNIFDVDTSIMAYDAEKKAQDIETYGLYTYDDFAELIPEEAYNAFNGAYLKVAIGKGMLTWEDIEYLVERYGPLM